MVTVPIPGLDKVAARVWVLPTGTLPKLMLLGFRVTPLEVLVVPFCACCAAGELAFRAEQPSIVVSVRRRTTRVPRVPKSFTGASTNAVRPYGRGFTCWLRHSEGQSPKRPKRGIVQPNAVCSEGCAGGRYRK